jgi:hypothetical protein
VAREEEGQAEKVTDEEDELIEPEPEPEPADPTAFPGVAPKQAAFLWALVFFGGHRTKACAAAKVARSQLYRWIEDDATFKVQLARAELQAWYVIQDAMIERAKDGVVRFKYYEGSRIAGSGERHYSDSLMAMIARANDVRYRSTEVKVKGDLNMKFQGELVDLLQLHRQLTKPVDPEPED